MKAPFIMSGYYQAQELTDNAFQDDYYRSGDIG